MVLTSSILVSSEYRYQLPNYRKLVYIEQPLCIVCIPKGLSQNRNGILPFYGFKNYRKGKTIISKNGLLHFSRLHLVHQDLL